MDRTSIIWLAFGMTTFFIAPRGTRGSSHDIGQDTVRTYVRDVAPILQQYCLSCHSTDVDNPSEYFMDDYESLLKGGKHGNPIVPGQPDSSLLYIKLLSDPPFGRQMPRGHKRITPEAVQVIHDWIQQGSVKE